MAPLYLVFFFGACDRGCISRSEEVEKAAVGVKQDCPTGLARCVEGAVEITEGRAACAGCPCAWKRVEVCARGCAIENVELVRERGEAATLCKGLPAPATLPQIDASETVTCPDDTDRFFCHHGTVYACPKSGSSVAVAVCAHGCAADDETLGEGPAGASIDVATATSVMCRHDAGVATP